jgi:hypothetical protein
MKMKKRATEANDGRSMRHTPENRIENGASTANYIAIFAILNAILERVANSLPQIKEATRMLPDDSAILNTSDEVAQSGAWR